MSSISPSALPASARKQAAASAGLFVGVRVFEDPDFSKVLYAVDDAVDLAHLFVLELGLLDPAKTVLLLAGEPQKPESRARLEALLAAKVVREHPWVYAVLKHTERLGKLTKPEGLFVVSFATHGLTDQGDGVLAVAGALKRRPVHTGLRLDVVLDDLSQSRAKSRLLLVDACRERFDQSTRSMISEADPFGAAFVAAMEKARGCAVLSGATRGGFAYDDREAKNGVFTSALLDGLRGEAEGDENALVTLGTLSSFANERVRDWVTRNKPEHKSQSLGISEIFDPPGMRNLPLAINAKKQGEFFLHRKRKALAHLVGQIDTSDDLFRDVDHALRVDFPLAIRVDLLAEIETFTDSPKDRRALRAFIIEVRETYKSQVIEKPAWAAAAGKDRYGLWADLEVEKVVQRLRFIEPGEFWMGSPESEAGRVSWEGPRHRVRLTRGFWLGATPCTQELWQQVMGKNPSRFQCQRRPVENVSWEEVQEFLRQLEARVPGVEPRLPTEAEWEYACRAGTETSTYTGELELLGERNAPLLDSIAWYSGNSGAGYELAEGADSRGWKEKQHPHVVAGTRVVGEKAQNPWGLCDMLGNVWEWCLDAVNPGAPYPSADPVEDPVGTEGSRRIHRGGSWNTEAKVVRAAYRFRYVPSFRSDALGFRFSLGQLHPGKGAE